MLKKSEILANLRRVGERNFELTLSQASQSRTLQVFIEDQDESADRLEPLPLVNKRVLGERSETDNFASLSSSNFLSKGQS